MTDVILGMGEVGSTLFALFTSKKYVLKERILMMKNVEAKK